jgi:glycosyltransferase involved in cell wall biosynthesis
MHLLILTEWYPPAYKAGGPIRSVYNLVKLIGGELAYKVLTSPFDLDRSFVEHSDPEVVVCDNNKAIKEKIKAHNGAVYLNSVFSWKFGILPLFYSKRVFLSPRGMLKPSALGHKSIKKQIYLKIANLLNLYKYTHFIASNTTESEEVQREIRNHNGITVLQNISEEVKETVSPLTKRSGELKLVHIGRIHRIKNLLFLLELMMKVDTSIELNIIGPIESQEYWLRCERVIKHLEEKGHKVRFHGPKSPEDIQTHMESCHFVVSPTLGENFGHAIYSALAFGRPVIISDHTPWRYLQRESAGWDIELIKDAWVEQFQSALDLDQAGFNTLCEGALNFARNHNVNNELKDRYIQLFRQSL